MKVDGLSMVPLLKGGSAPPRECFYWELHEGGFIQAVRFGDWKAVRNGPARKTELYDLKTDASESKDLAAEKPDLVAKAEQLMAASRTDAPNLKPAGQKKKAE
jgi:arylsulfatase A